MSLEKFFTEEPPNVWGSKQELERRLRIKLSVAAYAYEFCDDPIVSDAEFDSMCQTIDTSISTENKEMDNFFRTHFDSSTGQWIHKHPQLKRIKEIYEKHYKR